MTNGQRLNNVDKRLTLSQSYDVVLSVDRTMVNGPTFHVMCYDDVSLPFTLIII